MQQNPDKLSRRLFDEARDIATKISRFKNPKELFEHFQEVQELYEKSVLCKIMQEQMSESDEIEDIRRQPSNTNSLFDENLEPAFEIPEIDTRPMFEVQEIETDPVPESVEESNEEKSEINVEKIKLAMIKPEVRNEPQEHQNVHGRKPIQFDFEQRQTFIRQLFGDDEEEFQTVIQVVNQMDSKEEVLEFLSDVYHERKWKVVDRFAQEFWTEVKSQLS